ncbi:energy-coupling factor transporter ATPase [Brevibacillus fulvus]|nr:energy-coupling factor transporter ATPase [Brevibacillus fulvus]
MESAPLIQFENVSFYYTDEFGEKLPVLQNLNLTIAEGEFVTIIGHNGSGKSTLAKLMNALLLPAEGEVRVGPWKTGATQEVWKIRQMVGLVFQNPDNQIVGSTVEDDVAFGLENIGVPPAEMRERIDAALKAVGMAAYAQRQPHKLSGGQKQRTAIAGIIAMRPRVLILDEATAMLDPQGRKEIMELVRRLNREAGITVINISHFPEEAVDADRVVVMRQGKIFMQGTPRNVFADVTRLQETGLDVPLAVRIQHYLSANGVPIPPLLHQKELVEELCRLFLNR